MEFEETEAYTPTGSKKTTVSKAASSVKKFVTKRLAKGVSSERTLGSARSVDQAESPSTKRFSLIRHRRSKTRQENLPERGAVTDRARRSFSFDDVTKLDEPAKPKIQPLEAGVKVPDSGEVKKEASDKVEGLLTPETPVLEVRQVGTRTSSSANNALAEIESKGVTFEDTKPAAGEAAEQTKPKPKEEIQAADTSQSFDMALDAAATIDAGIEEAVIKSLKAGKTDKAPKSEIIDSAATLTKGGKGTVTAKPAEGSGAKIKTRDINPADLITQKTDATAPTPKDKEGQVSKPKRRRFIIFKAAPFSLATIAVGLLIMILKNKN